jgi:hypothetical protein
MDTTVTSIATSTNVLLLVAAMMTCDKILLFDICLYIINMDVFQLIGDFLHLIAVLMLLLKILANKNVIGISYKTQEIYMVVFITRYSDMLLEHHWGSLYFNSMRFIFIGISAYTIYVMRFKRPYLMVFIV